MSDEEINVAIAEVCGCKPKEVDLNAMHRAEETLQGEDEDDYYNRYLPYVSGAEKREQGPMDWKKFAHATARQRAEAFLKT